MIVTKKVDVISSSLGKKHITSALDQPIEVILTESGYVWIGLTDKLKKGMYECKVVYHLKWKGLGE